MTKEAIDQGVTPPLTGQPPVEQVTPPEKAEEKPLTREEIKSMMKEAATEGAEQGFRRAQGLTQQVENRVQGELKRLKDHLGFDVSVQQEQKIRDDIIAQEQTTPPANSGQEQAQTPPGSQAQPPMDAVTQKAYDKQEAKGVFFSENDPELAGIVTDKGEEDYLKSVDDALAKKISRIAAAPADPTNPVRTPTSLGGGGSTPVESFGEKSMDEAWDKAGF